MGNNKAITSDFCFFVFPSWFFSGYFLDFLVKIYGSGVDREVREGVRFVSADFGPNPTTGSPVKGNNRGAKIMIIIPDLAPKTERER